MTQVDFYHGATDKLGVTYRLIKKAYAVGVKMQGNATAAFEQSRIVVVCEDAAQRDVLSEMLWAKEADSFLPHALANEADEAKIDVLTQTPIVLALASDELPPSHFALMINVAQDVPPLMARFLRLLEIVGVDEADAAAGRLRYKFYKDRGYPLSVTKLPQ